MNKAAGFLAALLCVGIACAAETEDDEWGDIGKADAEGWLLPARLPEGADRTLAECDGFPEGRVKGVSGYVWAEFFFDPASMERKPGGYAELHLKGVKGMLNGVYNRDCPADGHVVTKKMLVMEEGTEASFGVLKPDEAKDRERPIRSRLVSTSLTAVLHYPRDGAEIADNTPDFAWYTEDPLGVTVELSRSPEFPAGATMRCARRDQVPFLNWTDPLDHGVWHWRVTTASGYTTPARSFRQTADKSADCDPPLLVCPPSFMLSANKVYGFTAGMDAARVTAVLCGRDGDVPLEAWCDWKRSGVRPPRHGWPVGVSKLLLTVEDAKGNVSRSSAWVSYAHDLPLVKWGGAGGRVTIGGEPFDLVGLYSVDRVEDIDRVKSLGFNCVHSYRRDRCMLDSKAVEFLYCLEDCGMKTFVSINRDDVRRGCYSSIAEKVGQYLPLKCLLAWYLSDEPELQDFRPVTPRAMRRCRDFVKALDPSRPGIVSHYLVPYGAQRYGATADVHFSQLYCKTLDEAKEKFDEHRELFEEYRPDLRHTLLVNPRAAESAETLASQVDYARANGCGVVFYAWHEALRDERTMEKLERAMRLSGIVPRSGENIMIK